MRTPGPDHRVYRVDFFDHNPTSEGDELNAALPEVDQLPANPHPVRYYYSDYTYDATPDSTYESAAYEGGELLRCSREKHPELPDAQVFFDHKRIELRWKAEQPVYRTGRFWCKRIYR